MLYLRDKRTLLLFICLLMFVATSNAQNRPTYSQYMFNGLTFNPAYAGSSEALKAAALYRNSQWGNSVEDAPVTQSFSFDFPLRDPQYSAGLTVFNDKINILRQSGAHFVYSYRINKYKGKLSFGIQAGLDQQSEDQTNIKTIIPNEPYFDQTVHYTLMPNVGFGTYYYRSNIFAGISIPKLLVYSPDLSDYYTSKPSISNIMFLFGVVVPTAIDLKLRPSSLVQFESRGVLYDLNCNFIFFKDIFEIGVSWRSSNVLVGMALIKIAPLTIGYAYDYGIERPEAINTSHEVMLRFDLVRKKINAASPLYLIR